VRGDEERRTRGVLHWERCTPCAGGTPPAPPAGARHAHAQEDGPHSAGICPWADGWTSPAFEYDARQGALAARRIFLLAIVLRAIKDAAGGGGGAEEARQRLAGEAPFTHERAALCALLAVAAPWPAAQWGRRLAAYAAGTRHLPPQMSLWVQGPAPGSGRG
jgi:hypothetical protein